MDIVLNRQLPADLTMTDMHLLHLADEIEFLFSSHESKRGSNLYVVKRCADKKHIVDNYKVVYEDRMTTIVVADWGNAETTHTALLAMHNIILAYGT